MKIYKLLLATAGATVLLGALVSGAAARNFSVSNTTIRETWRELTFAGMMGEVKCQLTLEGSMHSRTAAKVLGTLVGYVTRVALGACAVGTATVLRETLPWHVRYQGFQGTLPRITSIIGHVIDNSFRIREVGGGTCLARTSATEPAIGTFHRNTATNEVTEVNVTGEIRTGAECLGVRGSFTSDQGSVSLVGTTATRITVTLI